MPDLDALSDRLEQAQTGEVASKRWRIVNLAVLAGAAVVAGLFLWHVAGDYALHAAAAGEREVPSVFRGMVRERIKALEKAPPPFQAELLDWDGDAALREAEVRHASAPDDPAFYQAYLTKYFQKHGELPTDFDATWRRIDPDNAFWPSLSWSPIFPFKTVKSVSSITFKGSSPNLSFYQEAAKLPHWIDYSRELKRRQRNAFLPARTIWEDYYLNTVMERAGAQLTPNIAALGYTTKRGPAAPSASSLVAGSVFTGPSLSSPTSLAVGLDTWIKLASMRLAQPGSLLPAIPGEAWSQEDGTTSEQTEALRRIGIATLEAKKTRWNEPDFRLKREQGVKAWYWNQTMQVELGLVLTALVITAFVVLETFRRSRATLGLAEGLLPAFDSRSKFRLITGGVLLPFLSVTTFMLTPTGRSAFVTLLMVPGSVETMLSNGLGATPVIGCLLLCFLCLAHAADRELSRRLGYLLAPALPRPWLGRIMILSAILSLIVPSLAAKYWIYPKYISRFLPIPPSVASLFVFIGAPLLWLMWRAGAALFRPSHAALPGVLSARLMLPPLSLLLTLLLMVVQFSRHQEAAILAQSSLVAVGPEATLDDNLFTDQVVAKIRKILEAP